MAGWRGTIGVVKPGRGTGSTEEFIRLMPEGVRVIPTAADIREYDAEGFREALDSYKQRVAELAALGICDLIHPEGAPPFMVRGLAAERELVADWESQYKVLLHRRRFRRRGHGDDAAAREGLADALGGGPVHAHQARVRSL